MNEAHSLKVAQGSSVSLGVRMLAAFSLIMVISAVVVTLFIGHILRETSLFEKGEQFTRHADFLAQRINTDIENLNQAIAIRASNIFHVGLTKDLPTLQRAFERLQTVKPEYNWIGYANREGHVLAATGGFLVGETLASLPWFQSALQGPTLSDRSHAGTLSQPEVDQPRRFIDLAHPVRNERGETLGIVVAHLGLRWFETLMHPTPSAAPEMAEALQTVITRGVHLIGAGIGPEVTLKVQEDRRSSGWIRHENYYSSTWLISFSRHKPIDGVAGDINWTTVVQVPVESLKTAAPMSQATVLGVVAATALIA